MRKRLRLLAVLSGATLISMLSYLVVVLPVAAFSVGSSATGWVTKASASSVSAYQASALIAEANTIAAAAFAASGTSLAIDVVAAATGWPGLGVLAGLGLLAMYYSSSDLANVKAAAATPGAVSVPGGGAFPLAGAQLFACTTTSTPSCAAGSNQLILSGSQVPNPPGCSYTVPTGWSGPYSVTGFSGACGYLHATSSPSTLATATAGAPATQAQIATYVQGLPSTDPNSIPAHQTLQGWGSNLPAADTTVTVPLTPSQLPATTVPASTVTGTDLVLNPNATQPAGPAPSVSPTQTNTNTSTTTSTTSTSGGVTTTTATTTTTDSPTISACSVGNHDQRTFGGVLQQHMTLWQGSGLYSALNLLKTLTWPTAFQTYSLTSSTWGTFTIDFSAYSTVIAALRTIIIALASFVAYRIVFVGGR